MATAVETVKKFMNVLRDYSGENSQIGRVALDDAVRQVTKFNSLEDAVNKLLKTLGDNKTYPDTDTRLQQATGMVLGAEGNYSVDTGAITGSNAGGSTVKDAQWIVPEGDNTVDLSTLPLPEPGSTTPITYTGSDGKSFTFYAKWPDNFTVVVDGFKEGEEDYIGRMKDLRYRLDLNTFDENDHYEFTVTTSDDTTETLKSPTYGQMKNSITTSLKGLYNYWLAEGAKLNYDSLGMALNGQTIEILFCAGGEYNEFAADTEPIRLDTLPDDKIQIGISLYACGEMDPTDPNGKSTNSAGKVRMYWDRIMAHELVHAVMISNGTIKHDMPQFFTEGIADLVQGDDDYNAGETQHIVEMVNNTDTLKLGLNFAEGTGDAYPYSAGDMFMRYLAKQNLDVTPLTGVTSESEVFSYDTGSAVITNYLNGDSVNYQKSIGDAWTTDSLNDLVIKENTGNSDENLLILRDAGGTIINLNTPNGTAYAYKVINTSAELDGRTFNDGSHYTILFGADYLNNVIRAGNGGSQLWGGMYGNDELHGGAGQDTFIYRYNSGNDNFQDLEGQDTIFLRDMTLDNITGAQFTDYGSYFRFSDGGSLVINGQPSTFRVQDNNNHSTIYRADYQNTVWKEV